MQSLYYFVEGKKERNQKAFNLQVVMDLALKIVEETGVDLSMIATGLIFIDRGEGVFCFNFFLA